MPAVPTSPDTVAHFPLLFGLRYSGYVTYDLMAGRARA